MRTKRKALPSIVSPDEWLKARHKLLVKEKRLTRTLDALAAERRRLPMVPVGTDYALKGPVGPVGLLDLFDQRRQLVVYHSVFYAGRGVPCGSAT